MALTREAYQALEDIVGPENISEEPAVLDGYAFFYGNALWGSSHFSPRPEAAVLPGSTEEIQTIIKLCNRYGIKCHAFSTGWLVISGPGRIQLDLRRMNRILEIDERNSYAVVEPYVSFAMLHHEAIKKGLRPNIIGAGPNCSVLASHTSMQGMGPASISSGYGSRNVLGVEWVLPTGELLRLGSLGCGAGWFCGDGPGPSLRGIMRGYSGALSGLGVFTKCAVKLYPWAGLPEHRSKGISPMYHPEIPENFRVYFVSFPSLENMYQSLYLISEAEVAYGLNRCPASWVGAMMTGSNEEFWELWQKGILQGKYVNGFQLVMAAHSEREMKYKEKCLKDILDKTGGWIPPEVMEMPAALEAAYVWTLWGGEVVKALFRGSGNFFEGHFAHDSIDSIKYETPSAIEEKKPFADSGVIMDDGESAWGMLFEQGTLGFHLEHVTMFDPHDPDSLKGMKEFQYLSFKNMQRRKTGVFMSGEGMGDGTSRFAGPMASNYHLWMRKIKKVFDPNTAMDPAGYVSPED